MGEINVPGDSPEIIDHILKASRGRCRCCRDGVDVRPSGASDHRVHTVSAGDLREGRDVPALMCAACASAMAGGGFTSVIDFVFSTRQPCPACSAHRARQIGYGMPTADAFINEAPWQHLGGCSVSSDSPEWSCAACGHEW